MASFAAADESPGRGFYPDLPSRPWHDSSHFSIAAALSSAFDEIRREVNQLSDAVFRRESEQVLRVGDWDVVPFYDVGRKHVENLARCPTISEITQSHDALRTVAGLTYVSRLRPRSFIAPHRGPTNLRLRCHLGIEIPDGDCGIRVGGEMRRWSEGSCIVFDDSFEHEAWNYTDGDRIILIVDVWHPDLTAAEVALLTGLHEYALWHARSLPQLWMRNDRTGALASTRTAGGRDEGQGPTER